VNFEQFAQTVRDDPAYRDNLLMRARAGLLPADVEILPLEMADGRAPVAAIRSELPQSRTLALIRPSAPTATTEEES
jgi:hypothetical protein